ncbi:hypothetical protein Dvina_01460 [Dactylosporangium vinaceum]|uniref:Uncharacterized protein n=1 Tax=Dactylosporangium vinaceum TaxID=53362 RepID=A0ABV5MLM7_9ACTN|nr:hypothetical protein [Dactylosporangium vinaceum]UAB96926.1 hypothetical protein Dvina_01460 [Dactylosporangium vinaceum]
MNTNVRDAGNFFLSVPVFEGRQTAVQSIPNNTNTNVTFDTEDVDNDNGHSTSTNTDRYTPQTAGRFQISGGVGFTGNATGRRGAFVCRNGGAITGALTLFNSGNALTTAYPAKTITETANGSTDYFTIQAFQDSGGALNTDTTGFQSSFSVRWVGTV